MVFIDLTTKSQKLYLCGMMTTVMWTKQTKRKDSIKKNAAELDCQEANHDFAVHLGQNTLGQSGLNEKTALSAVCGPWAPPAAGCAIHPAAHQAAKSSQPMHRNFFPSLNDRCEKLQNQPIVLTSEFMKQSYNCRFSK